MKWLYAYDSLGMPFSQMLANPPATSALPANLFDATGPVIAHIRAAFPDALGVYVFGSRAAGTANADSDLDLAVLVGGYAEPLALWDAAQALAQSFGCPVDSVLSRCTIIKNCWRRSPKPRSPVTSTNSSSTARPCSSATPPNPSSPSHVRHSR